MQECFNAVNSNLRRDRHGSRHLISGKVVIEHSPDTRKGKLSEKACLKKGKSSKKDGTKITTYKIKLHVEPGFGNPGAFVIENNHKHRFFLQSATLCYLPNQTPAGLVELREEELESLRGPDYIRPVLGGSNAYPYPRRGRTGRSASKSETISFDIYVPADERCSPKKLSEFIANVIQATAHFLLPEAKSSSHDSSSFESFDEIRELYSDNRGKVIRGASVMKKVIPAELFKELTNLHGRDEEFGRQMLAGTNPTRIRCLREFPPRGTLTESYIQISDIKENLDGLSFEQAMNQWRIYVLDHHDYLLLFLRKMYTDGVCPCATRPLLFLRNNCTLKPLAIELSYPGSFDNIDRTKPMVILPEEEGTLQALWQLARAHVAVNDSAYHQFISHWLHTHAVVKPFIIATRRQLSVMHPIHQLLDPHFKDTMHINALARTVLLNAGGILEKTLFTGKFSMELSSELYIEWRFDEQALPSDLIRREPIGAHILFQDYPYSPDGLDVWLAIQTLVGDFCDIFYEDDASVKSDTQIQAWWSEIRNVGHDDKRNETRWCQMTTKANLKQTLTTLTPDKYFLNMLVLPDRFQATFGIALVEVLSKQTSEEVYLGKRTTSEWIDNKEVKQRFEKFSKCLREIEKQILERNGDP
ncbi:putative Calmodulin [Hibiscus syriacus]|uniref:Calmodulin n=1 Tax=Hibiscus syriacus TaxID=106335 RepID=A0A6A3CTX1_HIBSY|nr:putative Calmodulin [Hibiscus syriacus]